MICQSSRQYEVWDCPFCNDANSIVSESKSWIERSIMEPHTKMKEECPFCHEQVLEVLWWSSHKSAHTSRSAVAKNTTWLHLLYARIV